MMVLQLVLISCLLQSHSAALSPAVLSENDLTYSVSSPKHLLLKPQETFPQTQDNIRRNGAGTMAKVAIPVIDTSQMEAYEHPKSVSSRNKRQARKRQAYPPLEEESTNGVHPTHHHHRESGPWGGWSTQQQCSRSCGGGVQIEVRECPSGHTCTGQRKRYVSCNLELCPGPTVDFRAEQCVKFDEEPFEGKYYKWLPYTKAPNRCELNCIPQGENFFYRHKDRVIDGTTCDSMTNDVCVEGVCLPVGCDKKLGSMEKEDKCRVCSGDGSTCKTVEGLFDEAEMEPGYNEIVTIPVGATTISIKERRPTNNYLAVRNVSDHYFLNGAYKIDFAQTLNIAGTAFEYDRVKHGSLKVDKLVALGPTTEELTIMNTGVRYEYSLPLDDSVKYEWRADSWSGCSVTCGQGLETRSLQCYNRNTRQVVDGELCANSSEPLTNRTCNTIDCPADWFTGEWEECSATCGQAGIQYRVVYCHLVNADGTRVIVKNAVCTTKRPPVKQPCNRFACPEWYSGPWSACSKQCGEAQQFRSVSCKSARDEEDGKLLPEDHCPSGNRPESQRSCNLGPCKGMKWVTNDWKLCSKCNDTTETRNVSCEDGTGRKYPDEKCLPNGKKPIESRDCLETPPCNYQWHASQWSPCSTKCGHGHQTRNVFCSIAENGIVRKIDEMHCTASLRLDTRQNCTNEEECTGTWYTSPWSQCSKECGGGQQTREAHCFDYDFRLDAQACDESKKPIELQECNKEACIPCDNTTYGCCPDNTTTAKGFYLEGCTNCSLSKYGCCSDNVTEATGPDFEGCPVTELEEASGETPPTIATTTAEDLCNYTSEAGEHIKLPCVNLTLEANATLSNETLLDANQTKPEPDCRTSDHGCCPDWTTPAEGLGNQECPIYILGSCVNSTNETWPHGCCPDNVTLARGPQFAGCGDASCAASLYGCCNDRHTIAFGPHYKGCEDRAQKCENSKFGCCEDGKTVALGPAGEGCEQSCYLSRWGCCPNSNKSAPGPGFEGCGCIYAQYGCCSDGKSAATGPQFAGCPEHCATSYYGCCPDGKTPAEGPNREGCPCEFTKFGCCVDGETPAQGPNQEGCDDCRRGKYGCCPDGVRKAKGPRYQGCEEPTLAPLAPVPQRPAGPVDPARIQACSLPHSIGTFCVPQYLLRWYFNPEFGACSQFWYGGCDGNENRFDSQNECHNTCIEPSGDGLCYLPQIEGAHSCPEQAWRYAWDHKARACRPFLFRCNGNRNNFQNYEDCEARCGHLGRNGAVPTPQPVVSYPQATPFVPYPYQYTTEAPVPQRFTPAPSADAGPCKGYAEKWYYDASSGQCQLFVYGGCRGNANRFDSLEECQGKCLSGSDQQSPVGESKDVCTLPAVSGRCNARYPRWYFERAVGECVTFTYTGCGGNENRFETKDACEVRCVRRRAPVYPPADLRAPVTATPAPESAETMCNLRKDSGPCDRYETKWTYNSSDGTCTRFYYGGCDGNANRFDSEEECVNRCGDSGNVCQLPAVAGPCRDQLPRFFWNPLTRDCEQFFYSGCIGNRNRFQTREECVSRCGNNNGGKPTKLVSVGAAGNNGDEPDDGTDGDSDEDSENRCQLQKDSGNCAAAYINYFYDTTSQQCKPFSYTGCGGNDNRFDTLEDCEDHCDRSDNLHDSGDGSPTQNSVDDPVGLGAAGPEPTEPFYHFHGSRQQNDAGIEPDTRIQEPSHQEIDENITEEDEEDNRIPEYDQRTGLQDPAPHHNEQTKPFAEAQSPNRPTQPQPRTYPLPTSLIPELCKASADRGSCFGNEIRWYFDRERSSCQSFKWSGCGGNSNRFESEEACERSCGLYRDQDVCSLSYDAGPCLSSVPKWFWDGAKGFCETFIFGGCYGNGNRFASREECENLCRAEYRPRPPQQAICQLPKKVGRCRASMPRWFFEPLSATCQEFVYGGCEGNENNFETKDACEAACGSSAEESAEDVCRMSRDPGPCNEPISMWFHDATDSICKQFTYGGCRGNKNLFESRHQCELRCKVKQPELETGNREEICRMTFDQGPCRETVTRYYYDLRRGRCQSFIYGGCHGNQNNFETSEECQHVCNGVIAANTEVKVPKTEELVSVRVEVDQDEFNTGDLILLNCRSIDKRRRRAHDDFESRRSSERSIGAVWFKNGQRIDLNQNRRYQILNNGSLQISSATPADRGEYSCAVRHGKGVISNPINITVIAQRHHNHVSTSRAASLEDTLCVDNPTFANCALVVRGGLCQKPHYAQFCCDSCRNARRQRHALKKASASQRTH